MASSLPDLMEAVITSLEAIPKPLFKGVDVILNAAYLMDSNLQIIAVILSEAKNLLLFKREIFRFA